MIPETKKSSMICPRRKKLWVNDMLTETGSTVVGWRDSTSQLVFPKPKKTKFDKKLDDEYKVTSLKDYGYWINPRLGIYLDVEFQKHSNVAHHYLPMALPKESRPIWIESIDGAYACMMLMGFVRTESIHCNENNKYQVWFTGLRKHCMSCAYGFLNRYGASVLHGFTISTQKYGFYSLMQEPVPSGDEYKTYVFPQDLKDFFDHAK